MKKIKILLTLVLVSAALFSFQQSADAPTEINPEPNVTEERNSTTVLYKILVDFHSTTSEQQKAQIRAHFKSKYGNFDIVNCPIINGIFDELWELETPYFEPGTVPPGQPVETEVVDVIDRGGSVTSITVTTYNGNNVSCGL